MALGRWATPSVTSVSPRIREGDCQEWDFHAASVYTYYVIYDSLNLARRVAIVSEVTILRSDADLTSDHPLLGYRSTHLSQCSCTLMHNIPCSLPFRRHTLQPKVAEAQQSYPSPLTPSCVRRLQIIRVEI